MARAPEPPAPATGPRLNLPIFLTALFGVLVVVHLWVQQRAAFAFGCTGAGDAASATGCAEVTSSVYSSFLGVSLLAWGALFYLVVAALRVGVVTAQPPMSEKLRTASLAVVGVGFLFVLYLVYVQAFVLGAFCVLCLVSSVTVTALAVLHLVERARPGPAVTRSAALKPYLIGAVALVVLAGADVLIMRSADAPATLARTDEAGGSVQAALAAGGISAECRYDVEIPRFRDFDRLLTMETPYEGSADAPVTVMKIFDPNCPHCRTLHQQLERIIPQLAGQARFYYKPYPIWDHSIPQVQALYLAGEEGKFFEMLDRQFANQQVLAAMRQQNLGDEETMRAIVQMADDIGMDGEHLRSEIAARKYVGLIRQQNGIIQETGIRSVPKIVIEGRVVASTARAFTAECLGGLIELAAQEKGAAERADAPGDDQVAPTPADS